MSHWARPEQCQDQGSQQWQREDEDSEYQQQLRVTNCRQVSIDIKQVRTLLNPRKSKSENIFVLLHTEHPISLRPSQFC